MKVTVCFGPTRIVVPCPEKDFKVSQLISKAVLRYKKAADKPLNSTVTVHNLVQLDGGILDRDDYLYDVADDREQLIAVYDEDSKGYGTSDSGENSENHSPLGFKPVKGYDANLTPINGIEVTGEELATPPPLHVRRGSESALNHLSPINPRVPLPPDPSKRWSAAPVIDDKDHPSSTPMKPKHEPLEVDVGPPGERGEGAGEEKVLPLSSAPSPLPAQPLSKFSRDSKRCSVQVLSDKSYKWAEAADKVLENYQTYGPRKEPLGGAATPTNNFEYQNTPDENQLKQSTLVCLDNDKTPLGIHVIPSTDSHGVDQGLLVEGVEPNGRIARDGRVRVNDVIVNINGKSLKCVTFHQAQEIFKDAVTAPELKLVVCKPDKTASINNVGRGSSRATPFQVRSRTQDMLKSNTKKIGERLTIHLTKGRQGLGFSITTRDNPAGGEAPIYIKNILTKGAAIEEGNLKIGDRLLEVNGTLIMGLSQSQVAKLLRELPIGEKVKLVVSRQKKVAPDENKEIEKIRSKSVSPKLPRHLVTEKVTEDSQGIFPWKQRVILTFEIPVHDSERAGLGVSVKGKTSNGPNGNIDLGIFIKNVIHGGAASRDGRLKTNDQMVNINGDSLLGKSNAEAMSTLRRAMHHEFDLRTSNSNRENSIDANQQNYIIVPGKITLTIARRVDSKSRDASHDKSDLRNHDKSDLRSYDKSDVSGVSEKLSKSDKYENSKKDGLLSMSKNPVLQRLTGNENNLRNESYYKATHNTFVSTPNRSHEREMKTSADGRQNAFLSPTVHKSSEDSVIFHNDDDSRLNMSDNENRLNISIQKSDASNSIRTDFVSQSSLETDNGDGNFCRDQVGRQSISEKRHATLDAKNTDTYQRSKKAKEEREKKKTQSSRGEQIEHNGVRELPIDVPREITPSSKLFKKNENFFLTPTKKVFNKSLNESNNNDFSLLHNNKNLLDLSKLSMKYPELKSYTGKASTLHTTSVYNVEDNFYDSGSRTIERDRAKARPYSRQSLDKYERHKNLIDRARHEQPRPQSRPIIEKTGTENFENHISGSFVPYENTSRQIDSTNQTLSRPHLNSQNINLDPNKPSFERTKHLEASPYENIQIRKKENRKSKPTFGQELSAFIHSWALRNHELLRRSLTKISKPRSNSHEPMTSSHNEPEFKIKENLKRPRGHSKSKNDANTKLGLPRSSSLESLQTMVQEISIEDRKKSRGGSGRVPRTRVQNESFKAAVDRSYDAEHEANQMETVTEEEAEWCGFGRGNSLQSSMTSSVVTSELESNKNKNRKKKPKIFKGIGSMFRFSKHKQGQENSLPEESDENERLNEQQMIRQNEQQISLQNEQRMNRQNEQELKRPNHFDNQLNLQQKNVPDMTDRLSTEHDTTRSSSEENNNNNSSNRSHRMRQLRIEHQRKHQLRNGVYPTDPHQLDSRPRSQVVETGKNSTSFAMTRSLSNSEINVASSQKPRIPPPPRPQNVPRPLPPYPFPSPNSSALVVSKHVLPQNMPCSVFSVPPLNMPTSIFSTSFPPKGLPYSLESNNTFNPIFSQSFPREQTFKTLVNRPVPVSPCSTAFPVRIPNPKIRNSPNVLPHVIDNTVELPTATSTLNRPLNAVFPRLPAVHTDKVNVEKDRPVSLHEVDKKIDHHNNFVTQGFIEKVPVPPPRNRNEKNIPIAHFKSYSYSAPATPVEELSRPLDVGKAKQTWFTPYIRCIQASDQRYTSKQQQNTRQHNTRGFETTKFDFSTDKDLIKSTIEKNSSVEKNVDTKPPLPPRNRTSKPRSAATLPSNCQMFPIQNSSAETISNNFKPTNILENLKLEMGVSTSTKTFTNSKGQKVIAVQRVSTTAPYNFENSLKSGMNQPQNTSTTLQSPAKLENSLKSNMNKSQKVSTTHQSPTKFESSLKSSMNRSQNTSTAHQSPTKLKRSNIVYSENSDEESKENLDLSKLIDPNFTFTFSKKISPPKYRSPPSSNCLNQSLGNQTLCDLTNTFNQICASKIRNSGPFLSNDGSYRLNNVESNINLNKNETQGGHKNVVQSSRPFLDVNNWEYFSRPVHNHSIVAQHFRTKSYANESDWAPVSYFKNHPAQNYEQKDSPSLRRDDFTKSPTLHQQNSQSGSFNCSQAPIPYSSAHTHTSQPLNSSSSGTSSVSANSNGSSRSSNSLPRMGLNGRALGLHGRGRPSPLPIPPPKQLPNPLAPLKSTEVLDNSQLWRMDVHPRETRAEIDHARSRSYDKHADRRNRNNNRISSDQNRYSHYMNFEQIQKHLHKNEEQDRLAKLASQQFQDFRDKQTRRNFPDDPKNFVDRLEEKFLTESSSGSQREQREYQSQRPTREPLPMHQRPVSNYFEYESVQAIMSSLGQNTSSRGQNLALRGHNLVPRGQNLVSIGQNSANRDSNNRFSGFSLPRRPNSSQRSKSPVHVSSNNNSYMSMNHRGSSSRSSTQSADQRRQGVPKYWFGHDERKRPLPVVEPVYTGTTFQAFNHPAIRSGYPKSFKQGPFNIAGSKV